MFDGLRIASRRQARKLLLMRPCGYRRRVHGNRHGRSSVQRRAPASRAKRNQGKLYVPPVRKGQMRGGHRGASCHTDQRSASHDHRTHKKCPLLLGTTCKHRVARYRGQERLCHHHIRRNTSTRWRNKNRQPATQHAHPPSQRGVNPTSAYHQRELGYRAVRTPAAHARAALLRGCLTPPWGVPLTR